MASPRGAHRRASVAALLLALSCCFCCRAGARADPSSSGEPKAVPAVIVFGDSTVDTGNNNGIGTILKSDFPPYGRDMAGGAKPTGRFCNGRLPPDFISEALGLPPLVPAYLDPAYGIQDFAQGVCFASAGTGLDNKTAGVLEEFQRGRFHDPGAENGRDDDDEWQRKSAVALQLQVAPPGIEGARPEPDGWLMDATLRPVFKAVGAGGPYLESLNFAVSVLLKTWSISNLKTD